MFAVVVGVYNPHQQLLALLLDSHSIADGLVVVSDLELHILVGVFDGDVHGDVGVDQAVKLVAVQRTVQVDHVVELQFVLMCELVGLGR